MKKKRMGFTLAEIIVASGLFLLLLGFFVPVFRICWQAWKRSDHLQTTQRDILALSYRLRQDYSCAKPDSLHIQKTNSNILISFLSFEAVQGSETMWNEQGEVIWRKWVQYFFDADQHSVRRREQALGTPSNEPGDPVPLWNPSKTLKVAGHITAFQAQGGGGDVRLQVKASSQEEESHSSTQISILPRLYALDTLGY